MQTKRFTRSLVAVAVAVAVSAGFVAGRHDGGAPLMGSAYAAGAVPELSGGAPANNPAPLMPAEAAAKTGMPDFSGLVDAYGPAVVNISAEHVAKRTAAPQRAHAVRTADEPGRSVLPVLQALSTATRCRTRTAARRRTRAA